MREPDAVLNLHVLFHLITGFANPVYELEDIETEDLETVDITEDASPEKICQKHTNMVSNNVGDVHL